MTAGPGLWDVCRGERAIAPISGTLSRLVESQEQIATLGYVDTLDEQALLEELLERVKPAYPDAGATAGLHYLLKTPFRYPPLAWGSRFGRVHEPSLLYGGGATGVALAESAYYRLVFWHSMQAAPPGDRIRTEHTLFTVGYRSERGLRLQAPPFAAHRAVLAHPEHYAPTQALGSAMRAAGVEAFEYASARDPGQGICVGLFTPRALAQKRPRTASQWICEVDAAEVRYRQFGRTDTHRYALSSFLVDGRLPCPA